MLFNSLEFAIFLPIVFFLYWYVFTSLRSQNLFIVLVSYLFYGWWDWRFLLLIGITTAASYASGIVIKHNRERPKVAFWLSAANVILNLLILCVFKYFNFFGETLIEMFRLFGYELDWVTVDILLPVGISFYTFQALSYTIDVYKRKIEPTHDIVSFFAYVSFFPQLVAGPIERATNLLPQFYKQRTFDYAKVVDGTRQILWGLFKKIVVADNCAAIADPIFNNFEEVSGSALAIGAIMFTFQIYGDFSGYSDIAIGVARLFGINLMQNFNYPYFSRDIAEFWRRWHISLTTWFRDYIYIPLGGSRRGKWISFRNTMVIFLVSGFWHGANWTFVVWGAYHALLFAPLVLTGNNRKYLNVVAHGKMLPSLKEAIQMLCTLVLAVIGWIIFRANTIGDAWSIFMKIFSELFTPITMPNVFIGRLSYIGGIAGIVILLLIEWKHRDQNFGLSVQNSPTYLRYSYYIFIAMCILYLGGSSQTFVYFQF